MEMGNIRSQELAGEAQGVGAETSEEGIPLDCSWNSRTWEERPCGARLRILRSRYSRVSAATSTGVGCDGCSRPVRYTKLGLMNMRPGFHTQVCQKPVPDVQTLHSTTPPNPCFSLLHSILYTAVKMLFLMHSANHAIPFPKPYHHSLLTVLNTYSSVWCWRPSIIFSSFFHCYCGCPLCSQRVSSLLRNAANFLYSTSDIFKAQPHLVPEFISKKIAYIHQKSPWLSFPRGQHHSEWSRCCTLKTLHSLIENKGPNFIQLKLKWQLNV